MEEHPQGQNVQTSHGDSLPVKLSVGVSQPAQRRFVLAGQPVVEVDQGVVALYVLVQSSFKIPAEGPDRWAYTGGVTRSAPDPRVF